MYYDINNICNSNYKISYELIIKIIGKTNTDKILDKYGYNTRIHLIPKCLERLKTNHDITGKNLVTFMCHSVASRIDDQKFWEGLEKLKTEYDITDKNLVNFMCDGVASRINNRIFLSELDKIKDGTGYKSIVKLKRNISKIPLK